MEHVRATEGTLNTLNFNEKKAFAVQKLLILFFRQKSNT